MATSPWRPRQTMTSRWFVRDAADFPVSCRGRRWFPRFPDANGLVADLSREFLKPSRHVAMVWNVGIMEFGLSRLDAWGQTEAPYDSRRRRMALPERSSLARDASISGVLPYTSLASTDSPSFSTNSFTYRQHIHTLQNTRYTTTVSSPNKYSNA